MADPHHEQRAMFIGMATDAGWSFRIRRVGVVEVVELRPPASGAAFRIRYEHHSPTAVAFGTGIRLNEEGRQVATYSTPPAARDALERMTWRFRKP
jgi:hypothetical protein